MSIIRNYFQFELIKSAFSFYLFARFPKELFCHLIKAVLLHQ